MAHVVITGASAGLGAALAVEMAQRGHDLGLIARRADALAATAETVRKLGRRAEIAVADVSEAPAMQAAYAKLTEALGPVDILVANAGMGLPTPAAKAQTERVLQHLRVNVQGVIVSTNLVLPDMLARGKGQVVAISSVAAYRVLPGQSAYCMTKAAVSTWIEGLDLELRNKGVAFTIVESGYIRSEMTAKNKFPMPLLMDADVAARKIANGIERKRRTVRFPLATVLTMGLAHRIPRALWAWMMTRRG